MPGPTPRGASLAGGTRWALMESEWRPEGGSISPEPLFLEGPPLPPAGSPPASRDAL